MTLLLCRWRACSVERESLTAFGRDRSWEDAPCGISAQPRAPWEDRAVPARPAPHHLQGQLPQFSICPIQGRGSQPFPSTALAFLSTDVVWSLALWLLLASEPLLLWLLTCHNG